MLDQNTIWAIIVTGSGLGGMLSAIVGYYGSGETFDPKKFTAGIIRGFFGGILSLIVLLTSNSTLVIDGLGELTFIQLLQDVPVLAITLAVLTGYTSDSITNKFSGMIGSRKSYNNNNNSSNSSSK